MPRGTKPFTQALHDFVSLCIYLLLAKRATLVKEPNEAIYEHASALPGRIPHDTHDCTIVCRIHVACCHLVIIFDRAREMPAGIADAPTQVMAGVGGEGTPEGTWGGCTRARSEMAFPKAGCGCRRAVEICDDCSGMTAVVRSTQGGSRSGLRMARARRWAERPAQPLGPHPWLWCAGTRRLFVLNQVHQAASADDL
jgi:hypothetical protein